MAEVLFLQSSHRWPLSLALRQPRWRPSVTTSLLAEEKTAPLCHVASQLKADFTDSKSDKGQKEEEAWPEGRAAEQNSGGKWE